MNQVYVVIDEYGYACAVFASLSDAEDRRRT